MIVHLNKGWPAHFLRWVVFGTALLGFLLTSQTIALAERTKDVERRLQLGLDFFPNVVAVDLKILDKRTEAGDLLLVLIYRDHREKAEELAETLRSQVRTIKKNPVEIVITDDPAGDQISSRRPCALFLTEWFPDDQFEAILRFSINKRIIVFSPFVGDVERGATAGIYISSKIRPSLNLTTLRKSKISIHEMFMKLSKQYE